MKCNSWGIYINKPHSQEFISGTFTTAEKNKFVKENNDRGEINCLGYVDTWRGPMHRYTEVYNEKGELITKETV